jgi:hypothetical protein
MRIASLLALGLVGTALPATARADESSFQPQLLLGAGVGVTDAPGPGFEGHVGYGVKHESFRVFGVIDHAYTSESAILGDWSVTRQHLALSALLVLFPIEGTDAHFHAALGVGSAWDTFQRDSRGAETEQRWAAVGSVGAGFKAFTLLARSGWPSPSVQSADGNRYGSSQILLVLATLSFTVSL